jgi:hypothetical protein
MTWRHPSITYGAVEPESSSPPPGRRRAAGWIATIIGVGLAASALSLALGGGGLALKAAAALVLELRMARPASHHPPTPQERLASPQTITSQRQAVRSRPVLTATPIAKRSLF